MSDPNGHGDVRGDDVDAVDAVDDDVEAIDDGVDDGEVRGTVHPFPEPRERVDRMGHRLRELDEPVDLAAVAADDELINALAAGLEVPARRPYPADDQVVALLSAWRADVAADPIPDLVDLDTAIAAVRAGKQAVKQSPSGRSTHSAKGRHLAPVAAAAAFLVLVGGGVSIGSATAEPDSALWPVSQVLFTERAVSLQAAVQASTKIENAKQALNAGQPDVAASELAQAQQDLGKVRPQEGQAQLTDVKDFLVAKAAETPSGTSVDPASPLRTDRSRPIPAGAALSQQPTATGTLSPTPTSGAATTTAPSRTSHSSGSHPTTAPTTAPRATTPAAPPPPLTDSAGATASAATVVPTSSAPDSTPATVTSGLGGTLTTTATDG